ncbi:HSP18 transcriptional regulator [Streptomyces sp. CA-243310]|uniref:HSP18 transcriptional regulator n=1 Tax=Streptomyces sp. CA-243310 TaxID=3240056 RepID=UPI003D8D1786
MTEPAHSTEPIPFVAATTALEAIDQTLRGTRRQTTEARAAGPAPLSDAAPSPDPAPSSEPDPSSDPDPRPALAALLMLREIREQLAGWESGLIETARDQGASWADLAGPLGVASRQAAERRYLRLRPGAAGSTGEQRVQATRDSRAADRTVTSWARDNAADLRRLAGQISALTGLPAAAGIAVGDLNQALAENDAAHLVQPLADARAHLRPEDSDLADRIDAMTRHTGRLRQDSHDQRNT